MNYKIYKMEFTTGVHFGNKNLEDAEYILHADTIFSAMCIEAIKMEDDSLDRLYVAAKSGNIAISDAFPYIDDTLYLPKPMKYVEHSGISRNDVREKDYKKLKYVPADEFNIYLDGNIDVKKVSEKFKHLGSSTMKVSANISDFDETRPYRVGTYYFNDKNGLYIIIGYEDEELLYLCEDILINLSMVGIGGKRSSGLGKFNLIPTKSNENILKRLDVDSKMYMSLSVTLPNVEEIEDAISKARYFLLKRSGFVYSESYGETLVKKNDLYVCAPGSCFTMRFQGDVYDVSNYGSHPVYRYAKPMLLGVD